jgi:hypothetical protein
MKPRLYTETTIPSYLTSRPSRDIITAGHQQTTKLWWEKRKDKFEIFISQLVLDEASQGDPNAAAERLSILAEFSELTIPESVNRLAKRFLQDGVIPEKASTDAAHIAICATHSIDFLMTWNCTHIANATIQRRVKKICEEEGFSFPFICTPEQLMGEDYVG